jgi:hypothetical protein
MYCEHPNLWDFIEIHPEKDLKFFADAYCSTDLSIEGIMYKCIT